MKENRLITFWKRASRTYLYSLLLNLVLLFLYIYLFSCYYEANDDFAIKCLVSGSYGEYTHHLVYMNALFGLILCSLYKLLPNVPWYDLFQYGLILFSFTSISYVFLNLKKKSILTPVAILISAYSLYVRPQYSKTAGFLAIAGFLLFLSAIKNNDNKQRVLATILLVMGSMLRITQFVFSCSICFCLCVPSLLLYKKDSENKKYNKKLVINGLMILFIVASMWLVDKQFYKSDVWNYYGQYNTVRTKLLDYGFPEYEDNKELYDSLNINENAYQMYQGWSFDDPDKFGYEQMRILVDAKESKSLASEFAAFRYLLSSFFTDKNSMIYALFCLLGIIMVVVNRNVSDVCVMSLMIIVFLASTFFVSHLRPFTILHRITHDLLFGLMFSLNYLIHVNNSNKTQYKYIAVISLFLVYMTLAIHSDNLKINNQDNCEKQYLDKLTISEKIHNNISNIYLIDTRNVNIDPLKLIFKTLKKGIYSNRLNLGGWGVNSQVHLNIKNKYNVNNPFEKCVDNDRAIIVSNDIDVIVEYISDYYNNNVKAELLDEDSTAKYYRIVTK